MLVRSIPPSSEGSMCAASQRPGTTTTASPSRRLALSVGSSPIRRMIAARQRVTRCASRSMHHGQLLQRLSRFSQNEYYKWHFGLSRAQATRIFELSRALVRSGCPATLLLVSLLYSVSLILWTRLPTEQAPHERGAHARRRHHARAPHHRL